MKTRREKMTKIYITIISIITVIAIIFGCFIHIFNRGHFSFRPVSASSVSDTIELSGDVDTVKIDMNYSGVTIAYADEVRVEYTLPENLVPDIELKNGTLSILQKNSVRLESTGWNDYSITVYIPEDTALDKLDLDLNAGNLEIADIPCADVNVKCDAGNIELDNIESSTMNVSVDAGNIEMTDCSADKVSIRADAGNIQLDRCTIDVFNADADAGNIDADDCTINSGEVNTDLGNISLQGEIGNVKTHTSLGLVDLDD
jgi:DUF4097 and DUF4098 domain-containing protein YvlB